MLIAKLKRNVSLFAYNVCDSSWKNSFYLIRWKRDKGFGCVIAGVFWRVNFYLCFKFNVRFAVNANKNVLPFDFQNVPDNVLLNYRLRKLLNAIKGRNRILQHEEVQKSWKFFLTQGVDFPLIFPIIFVDSTRCDKLESTKNLFTAVA